MTFNGSTKVLQGLCGSARAFRSLGGEKRERTLVKASPKH